MRLSVVKTLCTRQPATGCPSLNRVGQSRVRKQHCTARSTNSDGDDLLDWSLFSHDSDDLALPGFTLPSMRAEPALGKCYGCGAELQTESPRAPGFITEETSEVKRRHRQRDSALCSRCRALSQGEMVPAVRDFSYQQNLIRGEAQAEAQSPPTTDANEEDPSSTYTFKGDILITPQQLREQLKVIRNTKAVCVLVVDILDTSGSFLARIRNLVGSNPIIVVATKVDLLPKNTKSEHVQEWLQDFVAFKCLNCLSVHLLSNKTGEGLDEACASILSQRLGRDVYIIGAANVGKSAFVRCMLREMGNMMSRHFDAKATLVGKKLPMESAMPGTTVGLLQLGAFSSGGALYDTPGLHLHHRMLHILTPAELKAIHPKRKLRPYVAAAPLHIAEQSAEGSSVIQRRDVSGHQVTFGASCTYVWGALLRVDVLEAPVDTRFVFFGTGQMQVYACPLLREDEILEFDEAEESNVEEGESTGTGVPGWDMDGNGSAFAAASVAARGGLRVARTAEIPTQDYMMTVADVTMSGMPGWVSVVSGSQGHVRLRLWAPRGVEVHLRPPIPCPTPLTIAPVEWSS